MYVYMNEYACIIISTPIIVVAFMLICLLKRHNFSFILLFHCILRFQLHVGILVVLRKMGPKAVSNTDWIIFTINRNWYILPKCGLNPRQITLNSCCINMIVRNGPRPSHEINNSSHVYANIFPECFPPRRSTLLPLRHDRLIVVH